jgi:hypothetical protein
MPTVAFEPIIRFAVFSLALAMLPHRVVPWSVRGAFFLVLVIFFLPSGALSFPESNLLFLAASSEQELLRVIGGAGVAWPRVVHEVFAGLVLAVGVSVGMYGALLVGSFLKSLLFAQSEKYLGVSVDPTMQNQRSVIESLLVVGMFHVLLMEEHFSQVFVALGKSLQRGFLSSETADRALWNVAVSSGEAAFQAAFVSLLPVFFAGVLFVLGVVVLQRFIRPILQKELFHAAFIPALLLVLLLGVSFVFGQLRGASSQGIAQVVQHE